MEERNTSKIIWRKTEARVLRIKHSNRREEEEGEESDRWAPSGRENGLETMHGVPTDGAKKGLDRSGERQDQVRRGVMMRVRPIEQEAQGSQALVVGMGEEAEVAHLHEAFGEDVLEEAVNEFVGGEGTELDLASVGRAITEGDLVIFELNEAAVGDGNAEDIGS